MQVRFLLGPAGSGKTVRCLEEVRAELRRAPDGPPLILLAPKQATFQLERQLLGGKEKLPALPSPGSAGPAGVTPAHLSGYARLQILSFERLARQALEQLRVIIPPALNEEGRVMVLRALLLQRAAELKQFHRSARRPGFAQQLSGLLAELESHQVSPVKLLRLAQRCEGPAELPAKLHDLAVLAQAYEDWLAANDLQDANQLLNFATKALRTRQPSTPNPQIAALWLDGFAEMTPAELDLLAAVLPHCERALLAFCLDHEPQGDESWLSIWSVVGKTFLRCRERVSALPAAGTSLELLQRGSNTSRFAGQPLLEHLEANWTRAKPFATGAERTPTPPRLVACVNPESEATFAAREILSFARSGGRFRETAVLVRSLDAYHKPLARAFRRYGVPYFLDRREGVAHHPLAELTRSALRMVAFDWKHEDWFAALKAGFCRLGELEIDRLENEALARGWRGSRWRSPIELVGDESTLGAQLERWRQTVVPPFARLAEKLAECRQRPTGRQLANALGGFWREMQVEKRLSEWAEGMVSGVDSQVSGSVHATVMRQMNTWLENVELAFAHEALPLRDWLPVLEAGLANLTVGVVPPALDQVLIGAIDRSRNPDLRLVVVMGLNEGVFPAAPAGPRILSETDRDELAGQGMALGPNLRDRLANERYYGYIACTRASERLLLTWSEQDAGGRKLNQSPFVAHLRRLFPSAPVESFSHADWKDAVHEHELTAPLAAVELNVPHTENWSDLLGTPKLAALAEQVRRLRNQNPGEALSPGLAEALYGKVLKTSVSRLEQFASCPFRFFIHSGLRAAERKVFELDFREQGSFQHDVLQAFHEELCREGKRWRDISPLEARARVGRIAAGMIADFRSGLLRDSAQTEFTARVLTRALEDFIEVLVGWMRTRYQFDPVAVELEFSDNGPVPAWKLDLDGGRQLVLRGRIDRVDLHREPGTDAALCVVIDYKSSRKKLDPVLLENGVQLQLLSYLQVLQHWPSPKPVLGVSRIVPAGVFYVNLRGGAAGGESRNALADAAAVRKEAYRHAGRFDASALRELDGSGDLRGEQFNFRLTKAGQLYANSSEALSPEEFAKLLARMEIQLRQMGERVFRGEAKVDPYRKGTSEPCEYCDYAQVCRIDPWTHDYRQLRRVATGVESGATE